MKNKLLFLGVVLFLFIPLAYAADENYGIGKYGAELYGSGDVVITFTTAPAASSITSSGATITATTSEVATCRYSTNNGASYDDMTSFSTTGGVTSHSLALGGLSSGTSYTYYVKCQDSNNNLVSGSVSFTTSTGSGGSSGGSGGGTASASVIGQSAKELWASVKEGESVTLKVDNGAIGVSEVTLKANKLTFGVWVEVESVSTLPDDVSAFNGKTYKNVKITGGNTDKLITDTSKATVKFTVKKTWLIDNKIDKTNIALFRHTDNKWAELITTMDKDDGTYAYYTALTPGLSYFAIGEKIGAAPATEKKLAEMKKDVADAEESVKAPVKKAPSTKTAVKEAFNKLLIVPLGAAVIVVGILIWLLVKRKKSKKKLRRQNKSSTHHLRISKQKTRKRTKHRKKKKRHQMAKKKISKKRKK